MFTGVTVVVVLLLTIYLNGAIARSHGHSKHTLMKAAAAESLREEDKPERQKEDSKTKKSVCQQPIQEGECFADFLYWGYDSKKKTCVKFSYGGCDGNDNRFVTREECENTCGKQSG